jgi:hypothetical protein
MKWGLSPFSPILLFLETTFMGHRTPLFDTHVAANARMVDFGGFDMPVNYGSRYV